MAPSAAPQRTQSLSTFVFPHSQLMDEQERWVSIVIKNIQEELRHKNETEVSIFIVPKTLMHSAPTSYTPQHVSLGPNHCWHPELHDMEGHKISAAKNIQQHLSRGLSFKNVVDDIFIKKHDSNIRASYQRFIYFKNDTLAWVMAVDTAFLLEFLHLIYFRQVFKQQRELLKPKKITPDMHEIHIEGEDPLELAFTIPIFRDGFSQNYAQSTASRNAIVRDIVMLENQIPLFLLKDMLHQVRFLSNEVSPDHLLSVLLNSFVKKVCPFDFITADLKNTDVSQRKYHHLLDYLYRTILPKSDEESSAPDGEDTVGDKQKQKRISVQDTRDIASRLSKIKDLLNKVPFSRAAKKIVSPITVVITFVSGRLSKMATNGSIEDEEKPPEIDIPSATELARAGVRFLPIRKGKNFSDIDFNYKAAIFRLPAITLNENTEVVLRNLVAYEASNPLASLYFTRYTELMNGIIDTAKDVKFLKDRNIITNKLKSEEEAAQMWNSMSRSIKKKNIRDLDAVIKNVNKYYNGRWRMKVERFMRRHVYESWQFLAFLATVLLLLFEMFDAFCSVYSCTTLIDFKY